MRKKIADISPYFLTDSGRKRIARNRAIDSAQALTNRLKTDASNKPLRHLTTIENHIVCILLSKNGSLNQYDRELLYIAHALSNQWDNCAVVAVVYGTHEQDLGQWGADVLIQFDSDIIPYAQMDIALDSIQSLVEDYQPKHILLADDHWGSGEILRRYVAAHPETSYASDVIEISKNDCIRLINADQQEAAHALPVLIGIKSQISEHELELNCQLVDIQLDQSIAQEAPQNPLVKLDAQDVPLEQAPFIMSMGNGVADTGAFMAAAEAMGATIGGSRVVVDDGKLPRHCQVGATGRTTTATIYLAFGISGAVQHLEGIKSCGTVIAINTDESCAMVKRADLSYINDAKAVLDHLKAIALAEQEASTLQHKTG